MNATQELARIVHDQEAAVLAEWLLELSKSLGRGGAASEAAFREDCAEFLRLFPQALEAGGEIEGSAFAAVRELLERFSRARALQGFSPSETALFVIALKKPLYTRIRSARANDAEGLYALAASANAVLDRLALFTTEVYQKGREELITRQQRDMLELSTPVVKLWDGILALPMIGTLDSERTQVVMETLLQRIVETASEVAIIDITGVPTVDTLVAQHLLKTVAAARLMGVECIISGIRPQIAQTIVHLGVELGGVATKANLMDAFAMALARRGLVVRTRA